MPISALWVLGEEEGQQQRGEGKINTELLRTLKAANEIIWNFIYVFKILKLKFVFYQTRNIPKLF